MRPLPPTLRRNRRYLLFEILTDHPIPSQKEIYLACAFSVSALFGDCGFAEIRPNVVWSKENYAIIQCSRNTEIRMTAALACIGKVGQIPAGEIRFRTICTSGTIHGAQKKLPAGK